jgi:hypothetical protein
MAPPGAYLSQSTISSSTIRLNLTNQSYTVRYYVENLDVPKSAKILKPGQLLANFKGKRGQALKSDAPAA